MERVLDRADAIPFRDRELQRVIAGRKAGAGGVAAATTARRSTGGDQARDFGLGIDLRGRLCR